jgi:tetratricopeptide (TPR) repeat protein
MLLRKGLALLAVMSWRQSRMYADVESLYQTTIDRNPDCWMAHTNLGVVLAARGQFDEAIAQYQKALDIKPDVAPIRQNLEAARTLRERTLITFWRAACSAPFASEGRDFAKR